MSRVRHTLRRTAGGFAAGVLVLAIAIAGDVKADPAADALARLDELSQQALQTREAVTAAQRDADDKLAAQTAAENRQRADLAALDVANSHLASNQAAADKVAAMTYVSGRTGQLAAVLTAGSPQQLIDQLSLQRVIVAETADQMKAFHAARERAAAAAGHRRNRPLTPAPRPSGLPRYAQNFKRNGKNYSVRSPPRRPSTQR